MPQATLINSAGQKVVVDSNSPQAQQYFGQGFQLMGPDGRPVGSAPSLTPAPSPTATPAPNPVPNAPIPNAPALAAPVGTQAPIQATSTAPVGLDIFSKAMGEIQNKLSDTAPIQAQKAALLKQLYDSPLSEQEMSALTPAQRDAIHSGNRNLIDMEVRLLNDNIKGRANTLDQSMKYFTDTYQTNLQNIAAEKEKNFNNIMQMYEVGGSAAFKSMPEANKRAFEEANGLPMGFLDTPSLDELRLQETVRNNRASSSGGGGGGGGFSFPTGDGSESGPAEPSISFEDFVSQKEDERKINYRTPEGEFVSPEGEKELRAEYDKFIKEEAKTASKDAKTTLKDFGDQFEAVVINLGSVSAQNNARKHFQDLLSANNVKGAEAYLNRLALEGLSGKTLTDYNSMGTVYAGSANALDEIGSFASTNPGLYKTAIESSKPFLKVSKDQAWVDFTSKVQAAQAGYRNALFGAALTPQENELANQFLIDFTRDDVKTIETKLKNMKSLADQVQTRVLGEQRGSFTDRTAKTSTKTAANDDPLGIN